MAEDDLILLDRWCAGDRVAGNLLFRRHFEALYRFFEHKTDGDIDDLVQETFLACLRGRATTRPTLDFEELSVASLSTSIGGRLVHKEDRAVLLAALRALPLDQQLLLEMFYWEEL